MAATGVGWSCYTTNNPATAIQLTVKTLLRHVQDLAGFAIKSVRHSLDGPEPRIDVDLVADPRRKRRCSCCGRPGRVHDVLAGREWHFVPLWNIAVFLHYAPRRVVCPLTGKPTVEAMPWSRGKSPYAAAYMHFLARWARRLSWKQTAEIFSASWDAVRRSVEWVVVWGLEHRDLSGVTAVGIDELHHGRGKTSLNFLTLIYQIDRGSRRLLWIGRSRTESTLREGFDELERLHAGFLGGLKVVCSDMWKPFLKIVRECCGQALNVLDQVSDMKIGPELVRGAGEVRIVGDKGYDSKAIREAACRSGSFSCIPQRSGSTEPAPFHKGYYRHRHHVENFFQRIKRLRRIATRYDKLAGVFLNFILLAASLDWINSF